MKEYICSNCGYHKTNDYGLDNFLALPVYPSFNATIVMPFMAMQQYGISEVCPCCGKSSEWRPLN